MSAGRVTVNVPVKNRPGFLREGVAGVLAQTCTAWELVTVDDRSADQTPEVARGIAAMALDRVRVLTWTGQGPGPRARWDGRRREGIPPVPPSRPERAAV